MYVQSSYCTKMINLVIIKQNLRITIIDTVVAVRRYNITFINNTI